MTGQNGQAKPGTDAERTDAERTDAERTDAERLALQDVTEHLEEEYATWELEDGESVSYAVVRGDDGRVRYYLHIDEGEDMAEIDSGFGYVLRIPLDVYHSLT